MATLTASDRMTALEILNRSSGENDDARKIIEVMSATNEILLDAPTTEANDGVVNTTVVRTKLPRAEHRIYNNGVGEGTSQTDVVHDYKCEIAMYSNTDVKLIQHAKNPADILWSESRGILEGMGQEQAEDIVYGNHSVDPAYMDGFATRRNKIDNELCLSGGGLQAASGSLTSIYICKWGMNKMHMFYPRGASGIGVTKKDKGIQTVTGQNGKSMEAYQLYFDAEYGLSVRDPRALIRIANINLSTVNAVDIVKMILKAKRKLPQGDGTISILCGSEILGLMDVAAMEKNNVLYNAEDPWGRELLKIRDMRLRQVDAILTTEDYVA